jgi:multiple sugar transport system permease protein
MHGWYNGLTISGKRVLWVWGFLFLPVIFYSVIRFYPTFNAFYTKSR